MLFDIDWQGAQQLQEKMSADVVSIFILPPSMEELRARLHRRAEDAEEVIEQRLANARPKSSTGANMTMSSSMTISTAPIQPCAPSSRPSACAATAVPACSISSRGCLKAELPAFSRAASTVVAQSTAACPGVLQTDRWLPARWPRH
jgi:hypothetical protein